MKSLYSYKKPPLIFEKQYSVGQGGLHAGIITHKDVDVYIYDCGAYKQKNIENGIDELINDLKKYKNINTIRVFISHFHNDHVNGLDYLYDKLKESILYSHLELILPSISEYEKIFMLGHYYENDGQNNFKYEKFIINPTEYFNDKYRVIFLTNEYPPPELNYNTIYDKPMPFDKDKISDSHNYVFKNNTYNDIIWIYKTYYCPIDKKKFKLLKAEIENAQIDLSNATKDKQKEIRNIYKKYYKNINESSMCLYSGPINANIIGWMHTGDIKLKKECLKGFMNKYKDIIDNILIFQIPHHGSSSNSNILDIRKIKNASIQYLTTQSEPSHSRKNPKVAKKFNHAIKITEINDKKFFILLGQRNCRFLPYK